MLGKTNRGWVGVDIGERAIKVAQLHRNGTRLRLESTTVYRRKGSGNDSLLDDLRAAKALSEPLRGGSAAATLSMRDSLIEPADENTIAPADHCTGVWQAGPDSSYAFSTPTSHVESTVETLATAGLSCEVIDGPPLAIARGLQLSPAYRPDALLAGLDWGESCVTFVAARGGQAVYVRRLAAEGFGAVRRGVAESLGLAESEAERAMLRHGATSVPAAKPEARVVSDSIRSRLRPLIDELRRTHEHLSAKLKTKGPEATYLLGAAGVIPGLPDLLAQALDRPCQAWTAPSLDRSPSVPAMPDCLLLQAIALSALAWEAN